MLWLPRATFGGQLEKNKSVRRQLNLAHLGQAQHSCVCHRNLKVGVFHAVTSVRQGDAHRIRAILINGLAQRLEVACRQRPYAVSLEAEVVTQSHLAFRDFGVHLPA